MRYILDVNGNAIPVGDDSAWRRWYAKNAKRAKVKHEIIGEVHVVTAFIGASETELWRTQIIDPNEAVLQLWCVGTRADALKQHADAKNKLEQSGKFDDLKEDWE